MPVLGTLLVADGAGVVRIEHRLAAPLARVWAALTEPPRLAEWYGEIEGDLRAGGDFHVEVPGSGPRDGHVNACTPPHGFRVLLRDPDARPGQPSVTPSEVRLTEDDDGSTRLVLEVGGLPLPLLAAYGTGVQLHVEHLADALAGRGRADPDAGWESLLPAYEELAATIR